MKRREFLKMLSGILVVPTVCIATQSKNIDILNAKLDSVSINFNNIKIDGTFDEWIESIKVEVQKMLICTDYGCNTYSVEIRPDDWGKEEYGLIPAKQIVIVYTGIKGVADFDFPKDITYFGFAKKEFECCKVSSKYLKNLVNVRFWNMQWGLENKRENYFMLLRRFNPKHETPNDYLH